MIKRLSVILYWAVLLALLALFFTNDFGLVDIHKTSIILSVGVDFDEQEEEVQVTAKVAVPKPSQSGDSIEYVEVQGSGVTVADALNEINAKTGTYPKLLLCKLILVGDSCKQTELFRLIGCFYRKDFSELTPLVAMCEGKASDMLAQQSALGDSDGTAIQKVLSDELEKSANVSAVTLRDIALTNFSKSKACYMPYIQASMPGTSESGGNGENVGGEPPEGGQGGQGGGSSSGSQNGGSGGSQGGSGGGSEGGQSGQSGGSQGGSQNEGQTVEFTARKTALFTDGIFAGILDEKQSFALNLLENQIRLAVIPCDSGGVHYTIGMRRANANAKFKVDKGVPVMTISYKAKAFIQGAAKNTSPEDTRKDDVVSNEVLESARKEIQSRFEKLVEVCREGDCDIFGVKELLYKFENKYYDAFKDNLLKKMQVQYEIDVASLN